MNERDMRMMYDGRRMPPRNARGEFMSRVRGRGRGRRGDRGMDYGMDGRVIRSYPTIHPQGDYARGDMNYDMPHHQNMHPMDYRGGDYRGGQMNDYGDMNMRGDGHYMHGKQSRYEPVEFMGYCQGYYGSPESDYGYNMGGRRYYNDYGYDYGDYGETLSEKELEHWEHKLMSQLDEREKQMFNKDTIMQKIKAMGLKMEGFSDKELYVNTLANYTDHKKSIGQNPDMAIRLAYDDFCDEDSEYKGAEWLAVYFDTFVEG